MAKLRQIAFYGKGGIGKSTTSQNTLAALAEMGATPERVRTELNRITSQKPMAAIMPMTIQKLMRKSPRRRSWPLVVL